MALIKCKDCKKEFSTDINAVRTAGRGPQVLPQMTTLLALIEYRVSPFPALPDLVVVLVERLAQYLP